VTSAAEQVARLIWNLEPGDRVQVLHQGQQIRSYIHAVQFNQIRVEGGRYTVWREGCRLLPRMPQYEKILDQILVHMDPIKVHQEPLPGTLGGRKLVFRIDQHPFVLRGRPKKLLSRLLEMRLISWQVQQAVNQVIFSVRGNLGEFK